MYNINIYKINADNTARFVLGFDSNNPLIVIGINPSTADDKKPDQTIKKVMGYADRNEFDGFIMINVYPLRATNPDNLPKFSDDSLHEKNMHFIKEVISNHSSPTILVAYGNFINKRSYLRRYFSEIVKIASKYPMKWKQIGNLTKAGNPRHPLMGAYEELTDFDIDKFNK